MKMMAFSNQSSMWVVEQKRWEGEGCLGLSNDLADLQQQNFPGRAGEGMTFSLGYLSAELNGFHLVEKWHSF